MKSTRFVGAPMPQRKDVADRSLEIICDLQEEDGGILATRTDDAYPFVYPRDGVVMTRAMNRHGLQDRSKAFYRFLSRVRRPGGEVLQRYNKGYPSVTQHNEFDVNPLVLHGVYDTYRMSGDKVFLGSLWGLVSETASFTTAAIDPSVGLVRTVRSIHETNELEEGYEIWANSAAVRGLLDASKIAAELGHHDQSRDWRGQSRALMESMMERLFDREAHIFVKNLRKDGTLVLAPDIAKLSPFYFRVCSDDSVLRETMRHLQMTLWRREHGGFNRFRDFEVVRDWHWYTGGTGGAWPLFTIWAAGFYNRLGMTEHAEECLDFVHRSMTEELCIPEKVAPLGGYHAWKENETGFNDRILRGTAKAESGRFRTSIPDHAFWACPLGWAHAEYVLLGESRERDVEESEVLELRAS